METGDRITFREALLYWLKLGFISFGGPAGQIAMMHKEVVEKRKWMQESHFLHALNFCMLLPGPEAQQLATYIGWQLHGTRGALAAGILFVLPSIFILWGLSWTYAALGSIPSVAALFFGLKPAVAAIVAEAVIRIGKKSLKNRAMCGACRHFVYGHLFPQRALPGDRARCRHRSGYLLNSRLTGAAPASGKG